MHKGCRLRISFRKDRVPALGLYLIWRLKKEPAHGYSLIEEISSNPVIPHLRVSAIYRKVGRVLRPWAQVNAASDFASIFRMSGIPCACAGFRAERGPLFEKFNMILSRLEKEGYIKSLPASAGGRLRKVYCTTSKGWAAFGATKANFARHRRFREFVKALVG